VREIWLSLPPEYGTYMVSSLGRVKSKPRQRSAGKILKPSKHIKGYLNVTINYKGKRICKTIHRLMAIAFLNIKPGQQVNHKDGDKANNMLSNLEVCTPSHNQKHRSWILNKRNKRKVSDDIVDKIRKEYSEGLSTRKLAKKYGYSPTGIRYICQDNRGAEWRKENG